ncbi:hypothetical protein BU15DRAFT_50184 [Melanogaster broomeanus]|nr:hypothetical protein BU15DRAFT_50184 [Melanogaster broomeanus]
MSTTASAAALTPTTPAAIGPINDDRDCNVRFDTQCELIPETAPPPRIPRVVTKSYTLPLWKRRAASSGSAELEDPSAGEDHVVLRVLLPSFLTKPQSPTRTTDQSPLVPCLVHRSPSVGSSSTPGSPTLTRRTSRRTSPSPSRPDVLTVPLRPCCTECHPITEAALVDGDAWTVRFSRAAQRRRSLSVDAAPRTVTVPGSAAASAFSAIGHGSPITVDEVDKRRRASDTGTGQDVVWLNDGGDEEVHKLWLLYASGPGVSTSADARPPLSPLRMTPSTPRIPEEEHDDDQDQLFPLPSPKRSPASSLVPSPTASESSLMVTPALTTSHWSSPSDLPASSPALPSGQSPFLVLPTRGSSSLPSLPKASELTTDLTNDLPRAPPPDVLSVLPPISRRSQDRPPPSRISCTPPSLPQGAKSSAAETALPKRRSPDDASPRPHSRSDPDPDPHSPAPAAPQHSSMRSRILGRLVRPSDGPKSPASQPAPPTVPMSLAPKKLRGSFSMATSRHIIANVFRGVGTMGSRTGVAGVGLWM